MSIDTAGLYLDGKPWLPVMGELHFSRVGADEWRRSLLLMRAGGISIASTYVFWIHHEEVEGEFDFTGTRDLRRFVRTCAEIGMPVMVRIGPWCHGEVRNGGLPDWVLDKPFKARTDDEAYLALVRRLFAEIARQLEGQLWKDGGAVIGIQIENEYFGPGEHLMTLKRLAIEAGLDVPLYTITGWPTPSTPVPFGELLPLFGAYAEGFWARELTPMPGEHWRAFTFEAVRTDAEVGMDQLGRRAATDAIDTPQYPYLTCEVGGGMEQSYHRRVLLDPHDTLAVVSCKIGSGSNLPGYYMYHGGTNPPGKLTTLQESQATKYWNDVPTLSYDFQAPLGPHGQVREPFRLLRRLHTFLGDFAPQLHPMRAVFPVETVSGKDDVDTLRCAMRAGPNAGFVFVSNYQRLQPMPAKQVRLAVTLASAETVMFPEVTVPADASFIWPVNLTLGLATLRSATAQPLCRLGETAMVFFETPGVPAKFDLALPPGVSCSGPTDHVHPSRDVAFSITGADGARFDVYLLTSEDALNAMKIPLAGRERLLITPAAAYVDGDKLVLRTRDARGTPLAALPPVPSQPDWAPGPWPAKPPALTRLRDAGPPREIRLGSQGVAEAPTDADFEAAAVYRIDLPPGLPREALLSIRLVCDVARLYHDGKLLDDHFYNGRDFESRIPEGATSLELRVLPLQLGAPIYLHPDLRRELGTEGTVLRLVWAEIALRHTTTLPLG